MEKEISSGTMLGIVLIALAAVIGLGFGVFAIAKGVANEGVVNVQDNLGAVSESAFTDYDQKIVTGTQVQSAYKSFQGKPVAILINTQAMNKGVFVHADHERLYAQAIGHLNYVNYNAILANDPEGDADDVVSIEPAESTTGLAVPDGNGAVAAEGENPGSDAPLTLKDGVVNTIYGFCVNDNGKLVFDTGIGGFTKSGNSEYIASNAKFDANLIKDASGQIVGVAFTQLSF